MVHKVTARNGRRYTVPERSAIHLSETAYSWWSRLWSTPLSAENSWSEEGCARVTAFNELPSSDQYDAHTRFEEVFEHAPIGMCLANTDGYFFRVNPAFC